MAASPIQQRIDTSDIKKRTLSIGTANPEFFSVVLDKTVHGKELGVIIDYTPEETLRIRSINDGMVRKSNEANYPDRGLQPGDEILKVNDVTKDGKKMARECKTKDRLRLLCKMKAPAENSVSDAKKAKATSSSAPSPVMGLYDFLPASNPENDEIALKNAEDNHKGSLTSWAKNRVLFLDIDGVLRPLQGSTFNVSTINIDGIQIPMAGCGSDFLSSAMTALSTIIFETGAQIVLSSEWRRHPTLRDGVIAALKLSHLPPLHGDTTTDIERLLGSGDPLQSFAERRVREIGKYLENHEFDSWVAIDDIDLTVADQRRISGKPLIADNFVRTEDDVGLTSELARKAIKILMRAKEKR